MKFTNTIPLLLLPLICLLGCKPKIDKKAGIKNNSVSVQQLDTANNIVPITPLPFGPPAIIQYKFPNVAWADPMDGPVSKLDKKYQEEFKKLILLL